MGVKAGPGAKYARGRKTTATLMSDCTGFPCLEAGLNFQDCTEEVAAEARDGMSRRTVLLVIAPFSSSETSRTTTPSAILWTGYGMSPADTTSAGLNGACAKL